MGKPGFKWLLIFSAFINLIMGFINVLIQPLIISLSSEHTLGIVLSITGIGMLLGGILVSAWGGPSRRIHGVFISCIIAGILVAFSGFTTSIILITASFSLFLFLIPIVNSSSQAIWQSKVDPTIQGRVFSIRRMLGTSLYPLSIIMAGPLVDKVFNPLMQPHGLLAESVGQIIGVGEGRGIGLLFIVAGFILVIVTVAIYLQPKVRNIEKDIPDAIEEKEEQRDIHETVVELV